MEKTDCDPTFFRMPPHRRVNEGLGDPPGVTFPSMPFSHPIWAETNEDLLYAHALATYHTWYDMD